MLTPVLDLKDEPFTVYENTPIHYSHIDFLNALRTFGLTSDLQFRQMLIRKFAMSKISATRIFHFWKEMALTHA